MAELLIDGEPWTSFTHLTSAQIEDCRARAERAGRFVDPVLLRRTAARVQSAQRRWRTAILGRPYLGTGHDSYTAFLTLAYALDLEPSPPADPVTAARRATTTATTARQAQAESAERQRLGQAWASLRAALPVPVIALYNYSGPLHLEFYSSGADHIVLRADLAVGRLRRSAGSALCSSASRRARQEFVDVAAEQDRLPTCQRCLQIASRLAPRETVHADTLMGAARAARNSRPAPGHATDPNR